MKRWIGWLKIKEVNQVADRSGRWIGEVKKRGAKRGKRFHVDVIKWTSERANLHVESVNENIAKNEDYSNQGCDKYPGNHARGVCTNVKFG